MSLSSVSFIDPASNKTLQVAINAPVPTGFRPFDQNNGYTYSYLDTATKVTITLPPSVPSPGTWILKAVIVAAIPQLSKGESYTTPSGDQIIIPSGATVPLDWKPVSSVDIGNVVLVDDGGGIKVEPAPPVVAPPPSGTIWKIIGLAISGSAGVGIAYLGYLAVVKPHQLTKIIENVAKTAGFIITIAEATAAVAIIAALSFVGWEFAKAMDANGNNVAAAIGSMLASTIEVFVKALVDTVETLAKDVWNFIITEIKSILPSWL